jgi:hypothetical protein
MRRHSTTYRARSRELNGSWHRRAAETIRFPTTRPRITLNVAGEGFVERATADMKLMGDSYPHYRADGGVDCWVVKATVRPNWLPGYAENKLVMWLDKYSFYPLRSEKYDVKGQLMMVEVRLAEQQNAERGAFGYAAMMSIYWNVEYDLIGYSVHDAHDAHEWTDEQQRMIFTPEFMRRRWLLEPLNAMRSSIEQFYMRPHLDRDKFPAERNMGVSPTTTRGGPGGRGQLVFESPGAYRLGRRRRSSFWTTCRQACQVLRLAGISCRWP